MLTFEDAWTALRSAYVAVPEPGQAVLRGGAHRASELASPNVVVVHSDRIELDEARPSVRMFAALEVGVDGSLSQFPQLESLVIDGGLVLPDVPLSVRNVIARREQIRQLRGHQLERVFISRVAEPADVPTAPLRWLRVNPLSGVRKILNGQDSLERLDLELESASVARMALIGPKPHLEECSLRWAGVRSLSGMEQWSSLRQLRLHMTGAPSIEPLIETGLEDLTIVARGRGPSLAPLDQLVHMRALELNVSGELQSLGNFEHSTELESVTIRNLQVGPKGLDGLALAPRLRSVQLTSDAGPAIDRFRHLRPDIDLHVWEVPDRRPAAKVGLVELRQTNEGWMIYQDLTQILGVTTNYDAEKAVRNALNADLAAAVEFDTEADAFCALASDRVTIDAVAVAIGRLT